jgi:hypothetical protein
VVFNHALRSSSVPKSFSNNWVSISRISEMGREVPKLRIVCELGIRSIDKVQPGPDQSNINSSKHVEL